MAENYNQRHKTMNLPALQPGDSVVDMAKKGTVIKSAENSPRSYIIETTSSTIRRNPRDILKLPSKDTTVPKSPLRVTNKIPPVNTHKTRSGRIIRPPERLNTPEINPL